MSALGEWALWDADDLQHLGVVDADFGGGGAGDGESDGEDVFYGVG